MTSKPIRILTVEDEAIVAMDIQSRLELQGYTVAGTASTGEAAIALARDIRPDLVLMDIRLQGEMDGITAAHHIREQVHAPVIFLTAFAEEGTLERAKLAEPFGYILKPFDDRELHTIIEIAIYKHRAEQEIRHLNRLYAVLSQVNQMIVRASEIPTLLTDTCNLAVKFGQFPLVCLAEYSPGNGGFTLRAMTAAHPDLERDFRANETTTLSEWLPQIGFWEQAKTFLAVTEEHSLPNRGWNEFANREHLRASVVAAIRVRDAVWGVLCFHATDANFFGEKELGLMEEIALDVGYAIENLEREAEHRRMQEVVSQQEQMLQSVTGNMRDLLCLTDVQGRFRYATPSYMAVLGLRPEDLLGKSAFDPVHPEDRPRAEEVFQSCIKERQPRSYEFRYRHWDGHYVWVEAVGGVVLGSDGTVVGLVITSRDLTERKQALAAVRESEERYRGLVETTYDWVWEVDANDRYTYASSRVRDLLGYSPHEVIGRTPFDFMAEEEAQRVRAIFSEITAEHLPFSSLENTNLHKDGRLVILESSGTPFFAPDGQLRGYRGMDRDITERKHLEEQLRQAQKMEAVGQLAGGVAHDFNNILAVIMLRLELLRDKPDVDPDTREALTELEAQARRAANLTRQLLLFSRRSVMQVKPLDLNEVIENLLKMLRRLLGEHIQIEFLGKSGLPLINADSGMIEQVLMNLSVNARDAMPKGGRLTIATDVVVIDARQAALNPNRRAGHFVKLAVIDTGCGMNEATLRRIFEPFFTTKEIGKGTGLGLATAYGIVKQHQGWIEVESRVDHGTTFEILIPSEAVVTAAELVGAASTMPDGGSETILLVEDHPELRTMVGQCLRGLGYSVFEASSGKEALSCWRSRREEIDLLFTDMLMPEGMTGLELAEKLRTEKPTLKVIISSGYNLSMSTSGEDRQHGLYYLAKPYEGPALAAAVRKCLDRKPD